jgi:AraC-like DNA-binding protein
MFDLTIGVGPLRPLAAQLSACGVDAPRFFSARGIDPALLQQREARVPVTRLIGIWERAAEAADDPHFGLHAAAHLGPGGLGLVSDVCEASATVGDALRQLSRYLRIVTETVVLKLRAEGSVATVEARFRMPPFAQGRHTVEFTVGALFHFLRTLSKEPIALRRAMFRHRRGATLDAYSALFAAPVQFEAPATGLELEAAVLRQPLDSRHPERARALDAAAHRVLTQRPGSGPVAEQVARVVMGELRLGTEPTIEVAAKDLAMSPRSLQRALRLEDASFAGVVDELRHGLALHHLKEAGLSIGEVAFLLGFSETAAFYRAFKRWTGKTPLVYRQTTR